MRSRAAAFRAAMRSARDGQLTRAWLETSARPLLGQGAVVEIAFKLGDRGLHLARLDEGVGVAGRQSGPLAGQVIEFRVRGQIDVGLDVLHDAEGLAVVVDDARILRVGIKPVGRDRRAAEEEGGVGFTLIVLQRHQIAGAALGVTRRDHGGQGDAAQLDGLAVIDRAVDLDRREAQPLVGFRSRIDAVFQGIALGHAGNHRGAGVGLQLGHAAGMVEVAVAVQQDLDVRQFEAELLDVVLNHLGVLRQADIQQDVALGRGDQPGRQAGRADIVDVVDDLERLEGRGPGGVLLREGRNGDEDKGGRDQCFFHLASSLSRTPRTRQMA